MRERTKEKVYRKEHFYIGMAAIVSQDNWHKLSVGTAVGIADGATFGACHHGDISDAFLELCEEKKRREIAFTKMEGN